MAILKSTTTIHLLNETWILSKLNILKHISNVFPGYKTYEKGNYSHVCCACSKKLERNPRCTFKHFIQQKSRDFLIFTVELSEKNIILLNILQQSLHIAKIFLYSVSIAKYKGFLTSFSNQTPRKIYF